MALGNLASHLLAHHHVSLLTHKGDLAVSSSDLTSEAMPCHFRASCYRQRHLGWEECQGHAAAGRYRVWPLSEVTTGRDWRFGKAGTMPYSVACFHLELGL